MPRTTLLHLPLLFSPQLKLGDMGIYDEAFNRSWVHDELQQVRNVRPGFHWGLLPGLAHAALDTFLLRGRAPWTLRHG